MKLTASALVEIGIKPLSSATSAGAFSIMEAIVETKTCRKCKRMLSVEMFGKNKCEIDGLRRECKECRNKASRLYRKTHKEKFSISDKKYRHEHKEQCRTNGRNYGLRHKEKIAKHKKLYRATAKERTAEYGKMYKEKHKKETQARSLFASRVRSGKIIRPDKCSKCGKTRKVEGHHEDYDKPFEVIWLCKSCHWILHTELKRKENLTCSPV